MGTLYLVRHGQASFGADDYDQLSDLGRRQSVRLGQYLAQRGVRIDAAVTGTLRRQQQTWEGIREGAGIALPAQTVPGLNEYDSAAVIETVHPHPLGKADTPEKFRHHFRLLRDGLTQWMNGVVSPRGMPSYDAFRAGVRQALDDVRRHQDGTVVLVSSGGPIATAVGLVLGCAPETTIELNMRIRNSAVTEFTFNPKRHVLLTYNTVPHLDDAPYRDWITYT
ncbi:histidine phosphatase family protein [Comamonadaceae bacterium G21597-S1]|nr:histidine phosphatase family protein [Comamonadaceae bacterium G21597-S1]